jgi:hypothetical protein
VCPTQKDQLAQIHAAGSAHHRRRRRRDQHLPAVAGGHDARRPVDRRPEAIPAALVDLPGMQAHTDPQRRTIRPSLRRQRILGVAGRGQRVVRPTESCLEAIAPGG